MNLIHAIAYKSLGRWESGTMDNASERELVALPVGEQAADIETIPKDQPIAPCSIIRYNVVW